MTRTGFFYEADRSSAFNFINGIPVQSKGGFHFFTLATYSEFESYQQKFAEALRKVDITAVFLNQDMPQINHCMLQKRGVGLRCCSLVVPKKSSLPEKAQPEAGSAACSGLAALTLQNQCANCSLPARLKCSRCESVYYCGAACQREHWRTHKLVCSPKLGSTT